MTRPEGSAGTLLDRREYPSTAEEAPEELVNSFVEDLFADIVLHVVVRQKQQRNSRNAKVQKERFKVHEGVLKSGGGRGGGRRDDEGVKVHEGNGRPTRNPF